MKTPVTLRLWAWWTNMKARAYDVTHERIDPDLDAWAEQLHEWNQHPESLGGAFYRDGVLYRRTWAGLIRAEKAAA